MKKTIIKPKEQTFYGTFGFGQRIKIQGGEFQAWLYWIEIIAFTKSEAEEVMFKNFGSCWANVYSGNQFTEKDKEWFYPLGCILHLTTELDPLLKFEMSKTA